MYKQTIKTNILTIFLILVGIVSASLLISQYYFNQKIAIDSTNKTFKLITNNISDQISKNTIRIKNILKANKNNTNIYKAIDFNPFHPALHDLIEILKINNHIYSIYFAHENGSFYELINMQESTLLYTLYKAPKATQWTIVTVIDNKIQYAFLDKNNKLLSKYFSIKKYNPLSRPWYMDAMKSDEVITTNPYLFSNLKKAGSSYAIKLKQKGSVLSIDFTMKMLSKLLALQNTDSSSEIFLFNSTGNKLASSALQHSTSKQKDKKNSNKIVFSKEEEKYIQTMQPLIISNEDWAPFDFSSAGKPMGYSIDFIKLISKKSNLKIRFYNGYSWTQIMELFKEKDIDIVHSLFKTPRRESLGSFTKPIYKLKNYFITQKNTQAIKSVKDIEFKRVAVVKDWAIERFLKNNYPNIELLEYKDAPTAFLAVSQNKADLLIDTRESHKYISKQFHIDNLNATNWFKEFDENKEKPIYMMLQKDNPLLLSIINKTIDAMSKDELDQIKQKWFSSDENNINIIDSALMKAFLKKQNNSIVKYKQDSLSYFTIYKNIENSNLYLGLKLDANVLLQPYMQNTKYSLIISFILLLISVPIIFFATNIIVKPIKALIIQNQKIKHREFSKVENIQTNIIEFIELSSSLLHMSNSIEEYQESQEKLLDSIVKLIAEAIDTKSPYTGGHCRRVPEIAQMLIKEANDSNENIFKDFKLDSKDEKREFEIAAWLHDCGKLTTPEYVIDKATKLETINNRIHEIRTRFEVLWRDARINYMSSLLNLEDKDKALNTLHLQQQKLLDDFSFIASVNLGEEFMDEVQQQRVKDIANIEWERNFDDSLGLGVIELLEYIETTSAIYPVKEKLLKDKQNHIIKRNPSSCKLHKEDGFKYEAPKHLYNYGEIYNLCIEKGTLTDEERYKIEEHVIMSIKMLEKIPFPENMLRVPQYAGTHHETLIGDGYPRQLTKDELSIPDRIMTIADIFEALTASDRPYKKAKKLSVCIKIMHQMVEKSHIDRDLFKLFLKSGVYKTYAQNHLKPEQIDDVDVEKYL